jgi:type VI secretion system Hcp family effector
MMKRLIGLAITVLIPGSLTVAAGQVNVTIDTSNQGQIKTTAKAFRYVRSPRDLANAQTAGVATAVGQTSAATTKGPTTSGRASARGPAWRQTNEPVTIVRDTDEASAFLVKAFTSGDLLPGVQFEFIRSSSTARPEVYQTVRLSNAMVSSVKRLNGGDRPTEEVSFTFQKIEYSHKNGPAAAPNSWSGKAGKAL